MGVSGKRLSCHGWEAESCGAIALDGGDVCWAEMAVDPRRVPAEPGQKLAVTMAEGRAAI